MKVKKEFGQYATVFLFDLISLVKLAYLQTDPVHCLSRKESIRARLKIVDNEQIICSVVEALYDPSDFIINVDFVCPKVAGGTMQIKVETDIPDTIPFTYCRDPFTYYYMEPDENEDYVIDVSFSGNDVEGCVLTKTESGEIYTLEVYVPMAGGIFTSEDLPHLVTCSYEDTTNEQTDSTIFTDSAQPIEESLHTLGKVGQSDVDLYLENILEEKVTSAVALGSSVRIVAELKGNHPDEVSFQAISCKAISNDNHYSILVGGCGDGIIVPRKKGFVTEGKKITSPFFKSFRIRGSKTLSFDCTFAICQNNCDGDSCPNDIDRKRREVRYVKVLPNGKTKYLTRDDVLVTGEEPTIDNDIIQSKSNINNMDKIQLSTLQIIIGKENGRIPESVIRLAKSDAKIGEAETDINFNDEFPIADSLYSDFIFNEPSTVDTETSLHDDASPKSKNPLSPNSKDPVNTSIWFIIGISVGFSVFLAMIMIAITKRVLSLLQSLDTTSTTANQRPPSLTMESVAVVENT